MAQVVKNLLVMQDSGDVGSILGSGRCPGGGNSNPFQYFFFFFLKNPIKGGAWWVKVHRVTKS